MEPTEEEWLGSYEAWSDGIDTSLGEGRTVFRAACEASFDEEVGDPPSARLLPIAATTREACSSLTPSRWQETQAAVVRALVQAHGEVLPPRSRPDLAAIATPTVGVKPTVYCWAPEAWAQFLPHYAIVRGGEVASLDGFADVARGRIDLDPTMCAALDRYARGSRPLELSSQNLELAEALTLLTHEALRLKEPTAAEPALECIAMQYVRPLVSRAWDPELAQEIALHAWQIAYPRLPAAFRTPDCRDGGPLDQNPGSSAWP